MPPEDTESDDAERVDTAVHALATGDLGTAESLLRSVIANTPRVYSNSSETEDGLSIKFWDQGDSSITARGRRNKVLRRA